MLYKKQGGIKYHFWVFSITRSGTEPPVSLVIDTILSTRAMHRSYLLKVNFLISKQHNNEGKMSGPKEGLCQKK